MSATGSLPDILPPEALSTDALPAGWPAHLRSPEAVVAPRSTDEVAATLRWAATRGLGVATVASGARFQGAELDRPFVVLSTQRLSSVEIYEPADLTLTARAGTTLAELDACLRARGQWLPFEPPRAPERSIGGLVASGESGPLWMGYGELRNHVLGMTVVTGDGRTLQLGGRVVKNVAGFDLLKPLVGSRGRLAVVTSVCMRAFPVPATDRVLVLRGDAARALAPVALAVGTAQVLPVSSVLLEPAPVLGAPAALLVRLHGAAGTVRADQAALERHCGVRFDVVDDAARDAVLAAARDAATGRATVVLSLLPSRLEGGLAALGSILPGAALAADTYAAAVRVAQDVFETGAVVELRAAIESLGGALAVHAGADAAGLRAAASRPTEAERRLEARLELVLDPQGVLWPCRA